MSSMQKFNFSRVGRSVLLALSTATALVSLGALAQDTTEPVAQSEEDVERISVSGRLMSSAASAAAERREQPYVAELLGMEQISRAGDSNAATALRRVTGLTLVKDKFIYVRGLGERYSSTLLNGAMVPSPDPTRNVIPLDMFPAGIIESLVVQKAYSPELPAAFGGGNVNIRTTSIPLQSSFNVSVGTGYNSLNNDDGYDYAGGGDDWRGKDDGLRGISPELAAAQQQYGVLTPINIAEALGGINAGNLAQAETIVRELGTSFNRDIDVERESVKPDFDGSVSFGDRFELAKNVVFGVMTGISYDRSTQNIEEQERYYSVSGENLVPLNRYDDIKGTEHQVKLSGMLNFGLELGVDHRIETSTIYLRDTKDEIKIKNGDSIETINENNRSNTDTNITYEERSMISNQVRGRHNFPFLMDLAVDWQYTDAKARRYAPGEIEFRYLNETQADGSVFSFLRRNQNAVNYSFSDMNDNTENLSWNAKLPFTLGKAEMIKEGTDITVVTYGSTLRIVEEAAEELEQLGISIEIIDPQTLLPFDIDQLCKKSLSKTNKLLVVDEDVPGGASAFILQQILEEQQGYYLLDSQPKTLAAKAHRPPYGSDGDYFSKPNADTVFDTVYEMMSEAQPSRFPDLY